MVARPGTTFAAQAAFVLERVVPEFVGKDITQHKPPQAVPRPCHDTFFAEICASVLELCALLRG